MLTVDESPQLTRNALTHLVQAAPPEHMEIEGRRVSIAADRTKAGQLLTASWDGGRVAFRLRIRDGEVERSRDEDRGHKLGLQAISEQGSVRRELVWITYEWAIRDAIRADESVVPLLAANSYVRRKDDVAASRDISAYGPNSRQIAERCGLGDSPTVELGSWSMEAECWHPTAEEILSRVVRLAIIKAHFIDRGEGQVIQGAPLFALGQAANAEEVVARGERLSSMVQLPGGVLSSFEFLLEILERASHGYLTPESLRSFLVTKADSEVRNTSIARMLINTGLLCEESTQLVLGPSGARLLETRDPVLLFEILRATYSGLEETLSFDAAHPGKPVHVLRGYLNRVLGYGWDHDTQARLRRHWLVTCGLLELPKGKAVVTELGQRVLEREPPIASATEGASAHDEEAEEIIPPEKVLLDPAAVDVADLVLPPGLVERCCAALVSGKHLLLIGPPGTGKSTLAERLAACASAAGICEEAVTATASADWTTYDTIGGWTQRADQTLTFREGVVTRALRERRWLVLDEVNRADIDKCFGELFTVLAGGSVTTAYTRQIDDLEIPVEIGPDAEPYTFGPWFRLIATMNVRDKASLFRLSYAFLRRFAVIVVPALGDEELSQLADSVGENLQLSHAARTLAVRALSKQHGLGRFAPLGPSLLLDVLRYVHARQAAVECAVAEAVGMVVIPQLEGLSDGDARKADVLLGELFGAEAIALADLRAQFRANFSHLTFDV